MVLLFNHSRHGKRLIAQAHATVLFFRSRAMSAISRDHGDSCSPLPVSFSQTPTPLGTFVANKGSTPIRQACHRTVEALFSRVSHVQSRIFQLAAYSVFKDHPPDTLQPRGQCGTLPFVRFSVKEKSSPSRPKRARLFSSPHYGTAVP